MITVYNLNLKNTLNINNWSILRNFFLLRIINIINLNINQNKFNINLCKYNKDKEYI